MESTQTNLQLKKNTSPLASVIFNFVKDNCYDIITSKYEMKHDILYKSSFYQDYIENKKEEFITEFRKINFNDLDMFANVENNNDFKNTQKTLHNFKLAVADVFKHDGVLPEITLSTTSPSPPLTRKVGNNKLEIKPTGNDYGLLFR